jgi:hypothetical protein
MAKQVHGAESVHAAAETEAYSNSKLTRSKVEPATSQNKKCRKLIIAETAATGRATNAAGR